MTSRIIVSTRVAADPARAFEVFTGNIAEWWIGNDEFRFTPRSPGRLAFEPPDEHGDGGRLVEHLKSGKVFEIGKLSIWEPAARIVLTWRQATFGPDHDTEVEIRFEPVGAETRVTVEHRGWERLPQDHAARHNFPLNLFLTRHGEYWRTLLSRLAHHITDSS